MTASQFYDASLSFSIKQDRLLQLDDEIAEILKKHHDLFCEISTIAGNMETALIALGDGEIIVLHGWCFWWDAAKADVCYTRERKYYELPAQEWKWEQEKEQEKEQEQEEEATFTPAQIDEAAMHAAVQMFADVDLEKIEAQIMLGDRDDVIADKWASNFFDPESINVS